MSRISVSRLEPEDARRRQLIETTIETMAEVGFNGATLGQIARRAQVSVGLVSHYFGDKDGLFEATLRHLARRVSFSVSAHLARARTARERVQAVIDANLAPAEFERQTCTVWLAFWGQVIHSKRLRRVQRIYQQRMLTNLRHPLRELLPSHQAERLAVATAAVIDGLWLRATLSDSQESDSRTAIAIATAFVDSQLALHGAGAHPRPAPCGNRVLNHIGGRWVETGGDTFESINPATGEVLATIERAGEREVELAVTAARCAQPAWTASGGATRRRILAQVAGLLRDRRDELAELEALDTGRPIREILAVDLPAAAACFAQAAVLAGEHVDQGSAAFGYTRREALGVMAGRGSWKQPLLSASRQAAPALVCGNAMIFAPSALAPLATSRLAAILAEAGIPPGIFNTLNGPEATGRLLEGHGAVRRPAVLPADGRPLLIVFDDAALDPAVALCPCDARVFVQAGVRDEFLRRICARAQAMTAGDPQDGRTEVGALISRAHLEQALSHIGQAGARLLAGGRRLTEGGLARGFFLAPTVLVDCRDDIPGPVITVTGFKAEDEVAALAPAGTTAGIFTRDLARGHRLAAALDTGAVWINHPATLPMGSIMAAIEHYSRIKSVHVALADSDASS